MSPLTRAVARAAKSLIVTVSGMVVVISLSPVLERWVPAMKETVLASQKTALPLIDQEAPKQVATATFALG